MGATYEEMSCKSRRLSCRLDGRYESSNKQSGRGIRSGDSGRNQSKTKKQKQVKINVAMMATTTIKKCAIVIMGGTIMN